MTTLAVWAGIFVACVALWVGVIGLVLAVVG